MVTLATTTAGPSAIASDDVEVFWATDDGLWKVSVSGGNPVEFLPAWLGPMVPRIVVAGGNAYFPIQGGIGSISVKGGQYAVITSEAPADFAFDSGTLFWTATNSGIVAKQELHGTRIELANAGGNAGAIAVDTNNVYWLDSRPAPDGRLLKVGKGGGAVTSLAAGLDSPVAVVTDGKYVYWTDMNGAIRKIPSDGGDWVSLQGLGGDHLVLDSGNLYASWRGVTVTRDDGGPSRSVPPETDFPAGLTVDRGGIYWTYEDGSNQEMVVRKAVPK